MAARRKNKYGAKPTRIDGIRFASKREATRFAQLKILERAGEIGALKCQHRIALHAPGGKVVGVYVADFHYKDRRTEEWIVADAKGFRTDLYKWKRRHLKAEYGIDILEF